MHLGLVAALREADQRVAGDLVGEAGAAVAQDAALAVEQHEVADRDRLLEVALLLDVAALARAVAERLVLQRALAALVAHRAVERVVGEQQLEHALLGPLRQSATRCSTFMSGGDGDHARRRELRARGRCRPRRGTAGTCRPSSSGCGSRSAGCTRRRRSAAAMTSSPLRAVNGVPLIVMATAFGSGSGRTSSAESRSRAGSVVCASFASSARRPRRASGGARPSGRVGDQLRRAGSGPGCRRRRDARAELDPGLELVAEQRQRPSGPGCTPTGRRSRSSSSCTGTARPRCRGAARRVRIRLRADRLADVEQQVEVLGRAVAVADPRRGCAPATSRPRGTACTCRTTRGRRSARATARPAGCRWSRPSP